jgi:hypothetical protein
MRRPADVKVNFYKILPCCRRLSSIPGRLSPPSALGELPHRPRCRPAGGYRFLAAAGYQAYPDIFHGPRPWANCPIDLAADQREAYRFFAASGYLVTPLPAASRPDRSFPPAELQSPLPRAPFPSYKVGLREPENLSRARPSFGCGLRTLDGFSGFRIIQSQGKGAGVSGGLPPGGV